MKFKKIMLSLGCLAVLGSGAYVGANVGTDKEPQRVEAFNQYAEVITWDSLVNKNADLIIRGTIASADGQTKVMELDTGTLYANRYTVRVEDNVKVSKQAAEQVIEVLETIDPGLKVGNEVLVFGKQKKNGTYAPVGEFGLFVIENGIAHGQLVDKDVKEIPLNELLGTINKSLRSDSSE